MAKSLSYEDAERESMTTRQQLERRPYLVEVYQMHFMVRRTQKCSQH
jgi:hypothetical protein